MRHTVFVHRYGPEFASFRYRVQIPQRYIESSSINEGDADIVVFSKPEPEDVELAKQCKKDGTKVVTDISDPLFEKRPHYLELLDYSDVVVCPTEYAKTLIPHKEIHVIGDPYEFPRLDPHCIGDKFLWFGHKCNLKDIEPFTKIPNLRIVSGPFEESPEGITFYSRENLERALTEADFTLFPTRKGSEYKSSNRLVNSIRMGTFPICSTHPSYYEFRKFVWVGNIHTGLRWVKHESLNDLISEAQDYVEDKFSPGRIGKQWKDLLDSI